MPTPRERAEPCYTSDYVNRLGQTVKIVHYMLCCTDCGALVPRAKVEGQPAPTKAFCSTCWADRMRLANGYHWKALRLSRPERRVADATGSTG